MNNTINIFCCLGEDVVLALKNQYVNHRHYGLMIGGQAVDVYKSDGSPLLIYRPRAIPSAICYHALPALRQAAKYSDHRGYQSGIGGAYDMPDCRLTAFTAQDSARWANCLPLIRAADAVFMEEYRERWLKQRLKAVFETDPKFVIGNTSFTTITVNRWSEHYDARTPVHQDDGDLPEGFGVITVVNTGQYEGGQLVFPKFGVAVDLRLGDVLLCDVHQYHGNAPIVGQPGWERISVVLYYRTRLADCPKDRG